MLEVIDTRELITLDSLGVRLRGTYHRPADYLSNPRAGADGHQLPGILFLNSLSLPRTATGDSALHLAESFAALGYPSFRFDLPGLGDSDGEAPANLLDFINAGGYGTAAAAMAKELVERMELAGVVIVGHCAGAVSALYAAAGTKECKGLVLMDPYFHLPQARRPKLKQVMSDWARRSSIGGGVSNVYDSAKDLLLHLRGNAPPSNANFPLLGRWKQVATTGLPILMLKAPGLKSPGTKPRVGVFDYLKHVTDLAGRKSQVKIELIEGTDHSFANLAGREAARQRIENWLATYFPVAGTEQTAGSTLSARVQDTQCNCAEERITLTDARTLPVTLEPALEGRQL
jgi:alpha-beta hydrolase superfamily lysophospholipase